jgi:hypothetical protein
VQPQPDRWRTSRGLAVALTALLVLAAAAAVLRIVALARRLIVLDDPSANDYFARASEADSFTSAADVVLVLVGLAIVPCFIVWCFRAAKNQELLARQPERLGAGWAIAGWFIPLANLVIPVLVIQDLWRGSDARIERGDPRWRIADRSWLVGWWWGLFVAALLTSTGQSIDRGDLDVSQARGANLLAIVGMVCFAAAAVLAILVVVRLNARQGETRKAQDAAMAAAVPAST